MIGRSDDQIGLDLLERKVDGVRLNGAAHNFAFGLIHVDKAPVAPEGVLKYCPLLRLAFGDEQHDQH